MKQHAGDGESVLRGDVEPVGTLIERQHIHMRRASRKRVIGFSFTANLGGASQPD